MDKNELISRINKYYPKKTLLNKYTNLEEDNFNEKEGENIHYIRSDNFSKNIKITYKNIDDIVDKFIENEVNLLSYLLLKNSANTDIDKKSFNPDFLIKIISSLGNNCIIFYSEKIGNIWFQRNREKVNPWSNYFKDYTRFNGNIPVHFITEENKLVVFNKNSINWYYKPSDDKTILHFKEDKDDFYFSTVNRVDIIEGLSEKIKYGIKVFTIIE